MKKRRGIVKKVLIGTGIAGGLAAAGVIGGRHIAGRHSQHQVRYAHSHSKAYRTRHSVRRTPLGEWNEWWR